MCFKVNELPGGRVKVYILPDAGATRPVSTYRQKCERTVGPASRGLIRVKRGVSQHYLVTFAALMLFGIVTPKEALPARAPWLVRAPEAPDRRDSPPPPRSPAGRLHVRRRPARAPLRCCRRAPRARGPW